LVQFKSIIVCLAVKKEKDIRSQLTKERKDLEKTDIRKNKLIAEFIL